MLVMKVNMDPLLKSHELQPSFLIHLHQSAIMLPQPCVHVDWACEKGARALQSPQTHKISRAFGQPRQQIFCLLLELPYLGVP